SIRFRSCTRETWSRGLSRQQSGTSSFISQERPLWRKMTRDSSLIRNTGLMVESFRKAKNHGLIFSPNLTFSCHPLSTRKSAMSANLKWDTGMKDYERVTPTCMSEPTTTFAIDATTNGDSK
ncbi:hypothetical protein BGX26_007370, partial [Mortierella sp. AD094]